MVKRGAGAINSCAPLSVASLLTGDAPCIGCPVVDRRSGATVV